MRLFAHASESVADVHLARALELAESARGATAPNPLVGCVIVADGQVVGEGFHERAGEPHAEVVALASAGERARGAAAYVTLEPCSHHGRTGPCADALIAAGIARVVIGLRDPNALAAGGADRLVRAGVEVDLAVDPEPFRALNEAWIHRVTTGRPFVTLKAGLSLDAHGAFRSGVRASITGVGGAEVTRRMRSCADAVLVGGSTVLADDPALTVRGADGLPARRQPTRVVLAGAQPLPSSARVLTDGAAPTLVLVSAAAGPGAELLERDGVSVVRYQPGDDPLDSALEELANRGIGELLVEPGPRLLTALIEGRKVDALVTVVAGGFAGASAPPLFAGEPQIAAGALSHELIPLEAGIVDDVSVTQWRPVQDVRVRKHGGC